MDNKSQQSPQMTGGLPPNPSAMPSSTPPETSKKPSGPKKSKKKLVMILVIVLLLAGGGAAYYFLKPEAKQDTGEAQNVDRSQKSITDTIVEITAEGLNPQTVKIPIGSQVTWHNMDTEPHRIAADPYPSKDTLPDLDSEDPLAENDNFSFIFDEAGTYTYSDFLNPSNKALQGTIIVE